MNFRRIVAVALLLAAAGLVLPPAAQAEIIGAGPAGDVDPGLFARILEWVQVMVAKITPTFVAQQGSAITGSG